MTFSTFSIQVRFIGQCYHHVSELRRGWGQYWLINPPKTTNISTGNHPKIPLRKIYLSDTSITKLPFFPNAWLYRTILLSYLKMEAQMTKVLINTSKGLILLKQVWILKPDNSSMYLLTCSLERRGRQMLQEKNWRWRNSWNKKKNS